MSGSRWKRLHTYHPLEGLEKEKKKTSLCVRGSVGSPTSAKHGPIEVNIYGGIFLPLQGLLVGNKRGSEILTLLKHDIHIKPKSYKLELLGELVI